MCCWCIGTSFVIEWSRLHAMSGKDGIIKGLHSRLLLDYQRVF